MNEEIQSYPSPETLLSAQVETSEISPTEESTVKMWRKRIVDAKAHFKPDFDRMRENMEFAANIQWAGQESVDDKDNRYVANFITNHVNQKVASLYAKDPQCEARCRKRLNYAIWDGTDEQMMAATVAVQQGMMTGMQTPDSAQAGALLQDIQQGRQWEKLCKRVGETLEILYGYQCDTQAPSFKKQMKQLVRRVITTGVGYVRLNFVSNNDHILSSSLTDDTLSFRIKRAKAIMLGIEEDRIDEKDPRIEQLRLLLESVESSVSTGELDDVSERIEFDFPSSSSIIVDPRCKAIKGFIGAEWIAQQYIMPIETANAYFGLTGDKRVTVGGDFITYADDGVAKARPTSSDRPEDVGSKPLGCFWEVFDYTTKEHFFICDGWKWYVQEPKVLDTQIRSFWPVMALTFNDVEVEPGQKVHIYPPSDVQLLKPMQMERNRSRQELREHRKVNRPFFWTQAGWVTGDDLGKFSQHETGELVQIKGSPVSGDMKNAIGTWSGAPIDQAVYSTAPLDDDARLAVGSNQAQQGSKIGNVAATPAVIQEQARMTGVSSNVDDLDDLLSELAQAAGEVMLRRFSPQTVSRIVGKGAAWPDAQRADFLNEIYLDIVAASSGRPNKAVDIQNAQQIVPMLLNAGANPWAVIKYLVGITDANLNPSDFAPIMQPQMAPSGQSPQQVPNQPLQPGHPHPGLVGGQRGGQPAPQGTQTGGAN